MVWEFLCQYHGILKFNEEFQALFTDIPADSTVPLKTRGYAKGDWNNNDWSAN